MRAMHPKSPAERRWGMHRASILPPRGAFAVRSPQIMHGARILPPSGGPAPAQGLLPEQPHHRIAFQRLGPCPGVPAPSASPIPATCQCLPLAVPVAARGKPPMGFGGGHPAHGLQSGQVPRDRRPHHLDGQADIGMLRRTGPGFQNREQVGAEPQAEAAGPAGPASALPKTPIERTDPLFQHRKHPAKGCFTFLLYASRKARYPRYASKISALEVTSHGACIESTATPESITSIPYFAGM